MPKLPDRWGNYLSLGDVIEKTRFITFKVPLNEHLSRDQPKDIWFTPSMLLEQVREKGHNLGLVIDLTFTDRYYKPKAFLDMGVQHEKILVPGHQIPTKKIIRRFYKAVDEFLEKAPEDAVVGVHCTHGVNRTGYVVCRYMIEKLGIAPEVALKAYKEGRGYPVERVNYIEDLMKRKKIDEDVDEDDDEMEQEVERHNRQGYQPNTNHYVPDHSHRGDHNRHGNYRNQERIFDHRNRDRRGSAFQGNGRSFQDHPGHEYNHGRYRDNERWQRGEYNQHWGERCHASDSNWRVTPVMDSDMVSENLPDNNVARQEESESEHEKRQRHESSEDPDGVPMKRQNSNDGFERSRDYHRGQHHIRGGNFSGQHRRNSHHHQHEGQGYNNYNQGYRGRGYYGNYRGQRSNGYNDHHRHHYRSQNKEPSNDRHYRKHNSGDEPTYHQSPLERSYGGAKGYGWSGQGRSGWGQGHQEHRGHRGRGQGSEH